MNTMQFCHYTTITQQYICVETKNIFGIVNLLYMYPCVVEIIVSCCILNVNKAGRSRATAVLHAYGLL